MKNKKIFLFLVYAVLFFSGCGKEDDNESDLGVGKSYFFSKEQVSLKTNAEFYGHLSAHSTEEVIGAEVYLVKNYENGNVYRFAIEPVGDLSAERLNIYFYVTDDKIYRLWSYVYEGDKLISFYDDDELLVEILDTDEKLINNGEIVCQDEEVIYELEPGEHGYRARITKTGNRIVYGRSDVKPNGDPGYCENFVWEKGKGLIKYTSKYGIERDILYLTDIEPIDRE